MTKTRRKLHIKTFGCQMNVYDSGRMADALAEDYETVLTPDEADMVILNTCHIREKASEKVFSELGRLRLIKQKRAKKGKSMLLGVAGCVAQAEGTEIMARAPFVDMVTGPQAYHLLPEFIQRVKDGERVVGMEFPAEDKFNQLPERGPRSGFGNASAFLAIQEGCDKFCSFCVVPYTRGAEYSRPMSDIVEEASRLAAMGAIEITLLGQNVNGWHGEDMGLGGLLFRLAEIPGLERLRYTTSHPGDIDDELIAAHRDLPKLMPYLHLPVQSGSDVILKAMNRRHNVREYLATVDKIKHARPDIALASDFIVGFPGESDRDFRATLDLVRQADYAQAYSFKYSPRPGTPAADIEDQVAEEVKAERLAELQALINSRSKAFNESCKGRTLPVLFDRPGRKAGQIAGRSPYLQAVHAQGSEDQLPALLPARIISAGANSLGAEIIKEPALEV